MAVYEATLDPSDKLADVIRIVRSLSDLTIDEIQDRLKSGESIWYWDTDEYPFELELEEYTEQIFDEIRHLQDQGCRLRFQYRPARDDQPKAITLEQLNDLLESETNYVQREFD